MTRMRRAIAEVSPAHAGMYLFSSVRHSDSLGFPRTRGDVPGWTVSGKLDL